jgi:outer membrane murein-binding lipoprotein Lpp
MSEANQMPITIEKTRLNLWNIVSIFIGIAVTAFGWGVTYTKMDAADNAAKLEIAKVANDVNSLLAQFPTLQFNQTRTAEQLGEARQSLIEANKRIDRVVESFGTKLDEISDKVNKIATTVEVLSSQQRNSQPQRTRFRIPIKP